MGDPERLEKSRAIVAENDDIRLALHELDKLYELHHSTIYLAKNLTTPVPLPYIRTTLSEEWVGKYLSRGYSSIDPILRVLSDDETPFDWKDIIMSDREKEYMREAIANGVGLNGYSIPYRDDNQRLSMFSVTSNLEGKDWIEFIAERKDELQFVGKLLHEKVHLGYDNAQDDQGLLSKRELEALNLSAKGHGYHEIAHSLGISEHTARDYLKTARIKLECRSLTQAAAKAVQLGLISV